MSFLDVLYPPCCLHCKKEMHQHARLCSDCLSHLTLLPREGHCERCFSSISMLKGTCQFCREKSHTMRRLAACFDSFGPGQTLLYTFLKRGQPHLAKEIASFVVVQLERLTFPIFDAVTMVPNALSNPQYVLGREVAKFLSIPFLITLRKRIREEPVYVLKRNCNLIHKRLFLLHTEMKTRQTIRCAAKTLADGWPQTLYGMTICAT